MIREDPMEMANYILEGCKGDTMPGWEPERMAKQKELFNDYAPVTKEKFWENLNYFLEAIMPACEETGVKMAIHQDDPPGTSSACRGFWLIRRQFYGSSKWSTIRITACACAPGRSAHDCGFTGYIRPDHGRHIWGGQCRPGYGLYDHALGVMYLLDAWEMLDKTEGKV